MKRYIQKKWLAIAATTILGMTALPSAKAGSATFDFSTDPTGVLDLLRDAAWVDTGGNPGGYLQITPSLGSQNGTIFFDDFDNGLVVKAFTFSCDLKIGDGTDSPADGFSVNYARENDPAIISHDGNGWAANPANEANLPEEGTQTGLAIGFDAWQSGDTAMAHSLPDGDVRYDTIGISVRVDNVLLFQKPMRTLNGAATDATSMQTGPKGTGDGTSASLTWQPLKVELTEDGKVNVWWKNVQVVSNLVTTYFPSKGRLVFTGRTGGAWQVQAIDNIKIDTIAASKPTASGIILNPLSLVLKLADAGTITVDTNVVVTKLNGAVITATSITKENDVTTAHFSWTTPLPSGSTNNITVMFKDSTGQTNEISREIPSAVYISVPTSLAVQTSAIDKSKPGFMVRPYGTEATQPNTIAWTEDQLAGLQGENLADLTGVDANGFLVVPEIINFAAAADGQIGNFTETTGYPEKLLPGFPGSQTLDAGTGNASLEILTFVEFPKSGVYTMGVNSDDGFKVSTYRDGRDKFALRLGYFDAGRGASDTLFNIYVEQAGIYPMRLIWFNGGGGANVEWFTVTDDGVKVPINAATNIALKAYRSSSQAALYVSRVAPAIGQTDVSPLTDIQVDIVDGAKQVDAASIKISIDGTAQTVTTAKTGKTTTATSASTGLYTSGSSHTVVLVYGDNSTPPQLFTNTWTFVNANYVQLPTAMARPVGSGTDPGFSVKVNQIVPTGTSMNYTFIDFSDSQIAGLYLTNAVDLANANTNGLFDLDLINWNQDATQAGNFGDETPIPGIPGLTGSTDNIAAEVLTYVEFPNSGFYTMGVNSDDGFKVTAGGALARPSVLEIVSPSSIAGFVGAYPCDPDNGGGAGPIPTVPIRGKIVYAQPAIADPAIDNTNEINGNIALIDRGTITFDLKIQRAFAAGATAVIIVNNRDEASAEGILPVGMGSVTVTNIPAMMISMPDGAKIKAKLTEPGGVSATVARDPALVVGSFNAGRAASDSIFYFTVPKAGVYPLRLLWFEGGGGANCEWFMVKGSQRALLNDRTQAIGLKAFRVAPALAPAPTLSFSRGAGTIIVTFTGVLQSSDKINGTFTDVAGAASPATINTTTGTKFYRARSQ